jgi:hypothetical protein
MLHQRPDPEHIRECRADLCDSRETGRHRASGHHHVAEVLRTIGLQEIEFSCLGDKPDENLTARSRSFPDSARGSILCYGGWRPRPATATAGELRKRREWDDD